MSKRYCVIGETAITRSWFDDADAAIEHAKDLIKEATQRGKETKRLLVMQEQYTIEVATPPIIVTAL